MVESKTDQADKNSGAQFGQKLTVKECSICGVARDIVTAVHTELPVSGSHLKLQS